MTRRAAAALAALVVVGGLFPVATPGLAAEQVPLRMYAASHDISLRRTNNGSVWLDLGIWIAAPDRPFEIQVSRDRYGAPIGARQVFSDGSSRAIPSRLIRGFNGFRDFFRVRVTQGADIVRTRSVDWCPGGDELQRINDDGPFTPRYPQGCYTGPFTLGTVHGIDRGWAVPVLQGERMRLDTGRYAIHVAIAPAFRELFGIEWPDASVSVRAEVKGGSSRAVPVAEPTEPQRAPIPTITDPPASTRPDLVALPVFAIEVFSRGDRDLLAFAANVWNRGPAPLIVEGYRRTGAMKMDAYQYFSDANGKIVGRAPVGAFGFDRRRGHDHWHFLQFVRYTLRAAGGGAEVRSHKQSFCLAPTDAIDLLAPRATWRPETIGFSQCGSESSIWIREVLPAGWGDTYYQYAGGQAFDITDLPNGRYLIEVHANPQGLLYDRSSTDDVRLREIFLRGTPGDRRVIVSPWRGMDV